MFVYSFLSVIIFVDRFAPRVDPIALAAGEFLVSFLAYSFVRRLTHPKIGKYAEIVGGIVLILIGLKILLL